MNASDLLTPWMMLAAVLIPLVYVEKWIHSHLYGVGWLLTNDNRSATTLYYVLLLPGILLHEVVQWLVAGAINVDTKSVRVWPEPQKDGTLRLDFVQIKQTNRISAALIGAAPLIVGLALVWVISNYILNLDELLEALGTGNLRTISSAIQTLGSRPDFYLWLYLLFAISNAMLPTPADRQGWPLLFMLFAGVIVFLIVIGTGDRLLETYQESVVSGLERLTTAFATVLIVEIPAILAIGFSEEILERTTNRKFHYKPPVEDKPRQPGSNEPLSPGEPKPSIYLLELPIPLPPDKPKPRYTAQAEPATAQRTPMRDSDALPAAAIAQPVTTGPRTTERTAPTPAAPRRVDQPRTAGMPSDRQFAEQPGRTVPSAAPSQSPRDASGTIRRPGSQARPPLEARRSSSDEMPTRAGADEDQAARTPDRSAGRPEGQRSTSGLDRPAPTQMRSPSSPDTSTNRPDRPAASFGRPPSERTERELPAQQDRTRSTIERPSTMRPPTAQPTSDDAPARPALRPSTPDQDSDRAQFTRPQPVRPAQSRPEGTERRERFAMPDDDQMTRPSQSTKPIIEDDEDDEDDELEYVPFDDVEIPDDDDL